MCKYKSPNRVVNNSKKLMYNIKYWAKVAN